MRLIKFIILIVLLIGCSSDESTPVDNPPVDSSLYFPPISGSEWETVST